MPKPPVITTAEWKVMKVLWAKSPQPAYDIIQALEAEGWHGNTIKTMLARLTKKKALAAERYKNLHTYTPVVTESECVQAESNDFLQRFFGGSVKPLLVHFAKSRKLSQADLDELRRILKENKE